MNTLTYLPHNGYSPMRNIPMTVCVCFITSTNLLYTKRFSMGTRPCSSLPTTTSWTQVHTSHTTTRQTALYTIIIPYSPQTSNKCIATPRSIIYPHRQLHHSHTDLRRQDAYRPIRKEMTAPSKFVSLFSRFVKRNMVRKHPCVRKTHFPLPIEKNVVTLHSKNH